MTTHDVLVSFYIIISVGPDLWTSLCCRVALSHSSSADSISEVHGPGADDPHSVSQWREVLPGAELPFEFEAREKLRHRCVLLQTSAAERAGKVSQCSLDLDHLHILLFHFWLDFN